jgi:hypothetical protein
MHHRRIGQHQAADGVQIAVQRLGTAGECPDRRAPRRLGHTRIAMISGPPDLGTTVARVAGFEEACRRMRLRKRDRPPRGP